MSDEVKSSSSVPVDPQMPGSHRKALALPLSADPMFYASKTDETLIRLAKLIKTTAGLSSLLSTSAYTLYIAAYLHAKSPTRAELISKIAKLLGRPTPKLSASVAKPLAAGASPFLPVISVINDTRFAIRLTGLVPLYVLLRTLIKNRSPKDSVLHNVAIAQALSYITFQIFENLWLLTNRAVIPTSWAEKRGGANSFITWSCRAWLVALTCDFARLAREALIAKQQESEKAISEAERQQIEQKWWAEFFTVSAWYPMAIHYSLPGGIGMNQGLIGLSGMLGGIGGFSRAWAATKD